MAKLLNEHMAKNNYVFGIDKHGNHTLSFTSPINIDRMYYSTPLGEKQSEMTLFIHQDRESASVEWVINDGEFVENIGLWFDKKRLTDYDGVFELPPQAIKLIRKAGFIVPKEFTT